MTPTVTAEDDDHGRTYLALREVKARVDGLVGELRKHGISVDAARTAAAHPTAALAQWERERAALVQCARALAFGYAGSPRPPETEPEDRAMWDAMHAAYDALGVTDTRNLPGPTP